MNLKELRDHVRARLDDEAGKRLWSDGTIDANINAAYVEAAERALLIVDSRELVFEDGVATLPLTLALDVKRVVDVQGRPLKVTSPESLDVANPGWEKRSSTSPTHLLFSEGRVRIVPAPTGSVTITVDYYRLPRDMLKADTDEPEIHRRHHIRMCDWALHLCYDRRDSDGSEEARSELYKARFEEGFGYRPDANVQRKQAEHGDRQTRGNSTW